MGIKKTTLFFLVCDLCGSYLVTGHRLQLPVITEKVTSLLDEAKKAGWSDVEGKFYCPDCRSE